MQSIMVYANEDQGFDSRLQAAMDVARAFDAHLTCVQVTPFDAFILNDPFGGVYALPVVVEQIRKAEDAHRTRVEDDLARQGVHWDWTHDEGPPAKVIADRSRLADLIVLGLAGSAEQKTGAPLSLAADVAIHARTPVLAVPIEHGGIDCFGPAVVAWNGAPEAAHALRFAVPLLKKASAVHIVTIAEDATDLAATEAGEYLSRHGIAAQIHNWPRDGRSVVEALNDAASTLRASYVVMGAYGHSRLREAVLGGVTRDMLRDCKVPLLLAH